MKPPRQTPHETSHETPRNTTPDPARSGENGDPADLTDLVDDTALWDLLGKAEKPVPVSPFFARNIVREIRLAEERKRESGSLAGIRGVFHSLLARWRPLAVGAAAAAVALAALSTIISPPGSPSLSVTAMETPSVSRQYDAEIIAQLDELLDDESVWLDSTVSAY